VHVLYGQASRGRSPSWPAGAKWSEQMMYCVGILEGLGDVWGVRIADLPRRPRRRSHTRPSATPFRRCGNGLGWRVDAPAARTTTENLADRENHPDVAASDSAVLIPLAGSLSTPQSMRRFVLRSGWRSSPSLRSARRFVPSGTGQASYPIRSSLGSRRITCWSIRLPVRHASSAEVGQSRWSSRMLLPLVETSPNKFVGVRPSPVPTFHPYEVRIGPVWDGSLIGEIAAGNIRDC
jgi:hypothetical protein